MRIKELREAAGLSQNDLVHLAKVDQAAVSRWENGQAMPRSSKLPELADILGCTIDALFGREQSPSESILPRTGGYHHAG